MAEKSVVGYRGGGRATVSFPTARDLPAEPSLVVLRQRPYQHDIVKLSFPNFRPGLFAALSTGVPARVMFKHNGVVVPWYGYVSDVTMEVSAQVNRETVVHLVGVTWPLKNLGAEVFADSTVPEAVNKLVTKAGMNVHATQHPRRFPNLAIGGNSQWEWLCAQARSMGYAVGADGANFYFQPIDEYIDRKLSYVPLLAMEESGANRPANDLRRRTLDKFRVTRSDLDESGPAPSGEHLVAGVSDTGAPTASVANSFDSRQRLREVGNRAPFRRLGEQRVSSYQEADIVARDLARASRFQVTAKATGYGDPRLSPWQPVFIAGTGPATDGLWVVREVDHVVNIDGEYTAQMVLMTDGVGANVRSTFRRRMDHTQDRVLIEPPAAGQSRAAETVLAAPAQSLQVGRTASAEALRPGQWVAKSGRG